MSRETLDDDRTASVREDRAPVRRLDRVPLPTTALGDSAPSARPAPGADRPRTGGTEDAPPDAVLELEVGPEAPPDIPSRRPRASRQVVVACVLTALVVGLLTAVVSTSAAQRDPAATAAPTLVGGFVASTWSSAENGVAPFRGQVHLVNTGSRAVEIWRTDLFGEPGEAFRTPVVIGAGSVGSVSASADLRCGAEVDESIVVEARVVDADGSSNAMQDVVVELLPTNQYVDVTGLISSACSVQALGGMAVMGLLPDGSVSVTLVDDGPADLSVALVPSSGLRVEADPAEGISLPEGGEASMTLRLSVEDCPRTFDQLAGAAWLVEPRSGNLGNGWVDGWDPNVVSTAVGMAYSRDCT